MPRIYATVSIYGETAPSLNAFLSKNHSKYPTIVEFVDAAVREKIEREDALNQNLLVQDMGCE